MTPGAIVTIVLSSLIAAIACRGLDRRETRLAMLSFALHIPCAFGHWALTEYYGGVSDVVTYIDDGKQFARFLEYDFVEAAPEVLKFCLHLPAHLPFQPFWEGSSSGTMSGLAGIVIFLFGPSILSLCLATTWFGWFGPLCFYRVAREQLHDDEKVTSLVGLMLLPSVVFWSAAFAKESFTLFGFGLLGLATYRLLHDRKGWYLLTFIPAILIVGLLKPYVLFPFTIAVAAWVYVSQTGHTLAFFRPWRLAAAAAIAVGGVTTMGTIFPDYAADTIAETMARDQLIWEDVAGGSATKIGSGDARTIVQQLPYVPLATFNSLFRPALFEAKNLPQLAAALETSALALIFLSLLGKHPREIVRAALQRSPPLIFCLVFVGTFAVAVGLATSNLGSLSRYRVPMMPFYGTGLLLLRHLVRTTTRREQVALRPRRLPNAPLDHRLPS